MKVLIYLSMALHLSMTSEQEGHKCCVPKEWEGLLFSNGGSLLFLSNYFYTYVNVTGHIAYSVPLQKLYLGIKGVISTPILPEPKRFHQIQLYDFNKGIKYDVFDNDCDINTGDKNMTEQCIPANTSLLTTGVLGDSVKETISTYRYNFQSFNVTATVHETDTPGTCLPVHVVYAEPVDEAGGQLISLDIMNIGPIKSTDIFRIPEPCNL